MQETGPNSRAAPQTQRAVPKPLREAHVARPTEASTRPAQEHTKQYRRSETGRH